MIGALLVSGCAHTHYYADKEGNKELAGLPIIWIDKEGNRQEAYVSTCSGFGTASFELERTSDGGFTKFSNNLDSTAAAQIAGSILDKAFEAGKTAARAEMREKALRNPDPERRRAILESLDL